MSRVVIKLDAGIFDQLTVDRDRNWIMPTGQDWDAGSPPNLKEARQMTTGIHKGWAEHKYSYSAMLGNVSAYGWFGEEAAAIDWDALRVVMESLERGKVAQVPVYDFTEHVRKEETVVLESRPFVVLEGLWLLHPEWLREKSDVSVFVDCPEEVRLLRRVERNVIARGRTDESVRPQFAEHVQPMQACFVVPQREWAMRCVNSPLLKEEQIELLAACRG